MQPLNTSLHYRSKVCIKNIKKIYEKYQTLTLVTVIIIIIIIISLGCIFFPSLFWDSFIWKYYWGPIEADATGETVEGIKAGYNIVNTITYGLILSLFLFGIYKLLKKLEVAVNLRFLFALSPFLILGSVDRVLEDSELFKKPIIYLFISPIIYFIIAGMAITFLLLGKFTEKIYKKKGSKQALIFLSLIIIGSDFVYIFIYFVLDKYFTYLVNPIWFILISNLMIILRLFVYSNFKKNFDSNAILFCSGTIFLTIGLYFVGHWLFIEEWGSAGKGKNLEVLPVIFILAILATLILYFFARQLRKKYPFFKIYLVGMNIAIVFAHFLDASATFIGVDYYGYYEKHVLPDFLISVFNTAAIMFVLKAIVIGLVIYLIDIAYLKELKDKPILIGLVKVFIFILGFAPGTRDVIRLAMGV